MIFPHASLVRSSRTRTRKHTASAEMHISSQPTCDSTVAREKTRPPPLQIIPELSENELDNTTRSPATARPTQSMQQPELMNSRITLSAYTFSIDDALVMFGGDEPRSPALSASSSTSASTSSEDVPSTPCAPDDDDASDFMFSDFYLRPRCISIRPLCITKTRSSVCQEDEDQCQMGELAIHRSATEDIYEPSNEPNVAIEDADEDFYNREFESFISICPSTPTPTLPARRDSLVVSEALPSVVTVAKTKPRGRSRHSKPLPLLPPVTPPLSTFPPIPTLPLVQTSAQKSVIRRKRNVSSLPNYPPPPPPPVARPLPRMEVPLDVDDCTFSEENFGTSFEESASEGNCNIMEDVAVFSQPPLTPTFLLPAAIPETPVSGMYGRVILPRSSTDSDAPRSSTDSTPSSFSDCPISPLPFSSSPSDERLRSRWSTSTLGSLVEPPRGNTLLSPFIHVFGSRSRRVPPLPKVPPQMLKSKQYSTTSVSGKHSRRHDSQSSASSATSSDSDSRDGSPSGLKRRPNPAAMFLRAT